MGLWQKMRGIWITSGGVATSYSPRTEIEKEHLLVQARMQQAGNQEETAVDQSQAAEAKGQLASLLGYDAEAATLLADQADAGWWNELSRSLIASGKAVQLTASAGVSELVSAVEELLESKGITWYSEPAMRMIEDDLYELIQALPYYLPDDCTVALMIDGRELDGGYVLVAGKRCVLKEAAERAHQLGQCLECMERVDYLEEN